jgi:hypothetical protein
MKFHRIFLSQWSESNIDKVNHVFLNEFYGEYFRCFSDKEKFSKEIGSIIPGIDKAVTLNNVEIIERTFNDLKPQLKKYFPNIVLPDIIFFIGSGGWDGHATIIKDKPYTFFDMFRMNQWLANSNFCKEAHFTHELVHAIHYYQSPEYYLGNYKTPGDNLLKRLIAEGMGTYLSYKITGVDFFHAAWLGIIDDTLCSRWEESCLRHKNTIKELLKKALHDSCAEKEISNSLFSVPGFNDDDLVSGRFGYYYGAKIIEEFFPGISPSKLVSFGYDKFIEPINKYFDL